MRKVAIFVGTVTNCCLGCVEFHSFCWKIHTDRDESSCFSPPISGNIKISSSMFGVSICEARWKIYSMHMKLLENLFVLSQTYKFILQGNVMSKRKGRHFRRVNQKVDLISTLNGNHVFIYDLVDIKHFLPI